VFVVSEIPLCLCLSRVRTVRILCEGVTKLDTVRELQEQRDKEAEVPCPTSG